MKSDNIVTNPINQAEFNKKLRKDCVTIVNGKIVLTPNPDYDPEYYNKILELNILERQKLIDSSHNGKSRTFIEQQVTTIQQPLTQQEYNEHTDKINVIYRRLGMIKDQARRMEKAKRYYADNSIFKISMQARIKGWQRQKERSRVTPAFANLPISQVEVKGLIEQLRNKIGKNKQSFNACLAVLYELLHLGRKGKGWIYISQGKLGNRLGFDRKTINVVISKLQELGLLLSHTSHYCPNIIQLTNQLITNPILELLAAFSYGRSYIQMRDYSQMLNNYDNICNNTYLVPEISIQKEQSNQTNVLGEQFLSKLLKNLNISIPVLRPDKAF